MRNVAGEIIAAMHAVKIAQKSGGIILDLP